jgi:hypothetical protein
MSRPKRIFNPNIFDQIICPPYGVRAGLLKKGDIVYKGKTYGGKGNLASVYIYTKDNILLGFCSLGSLEKI